MKKIFSLFILGLTCVLLQAQEPCVPGPETTPGIYPDTLTNLPTAYVNQPYDGVVYAVIPVDTTIGQITYNIDSIGITGIDNLPSGFVYTPNSVSGFWPGGGKGCVVITGTAQASQVGTYNLVIHLLAKVSGFPMPETLKGYKIIVVDTTNAINDRVSEKFELLQNTPNPFSGITEIRFNAPKPANCEFSVCNILGEVVFKSRINAARGMNTITFNGREFQKGLYLYKLTNGTQTITKRMTIE